MVDFRVGTIMDILILDRGTIRRLLLPKLEQAEMTRAFEEQSKRAL